MGFLGPCGPPSIVGDIFRSVFQEPPGRLLLFQTLLCTTGGWFAGAWPSGGEALRTAVVADLLRLWRSQPYMVREPGPFRPLCSSCLKFNMDQVDEVQRLIRYLPPSSRYRWANVELSRDARLFYGGRSLGFQPVSVLSSCLFRALLEGERRGLQDTNGRMTQQQRERVIGTASKYKNAWMYELNLKISLLIMIIHVKIVLCWCCGVMKISWSVSDWGRSSSEHLLFPHKQIKTDNNAVLLIFKNHSWHRRLWKQTQKAWLVAFLTFPDLEASYPGFIH